MAGDAGWCLGKVRSRDPSGKRLKEAEGQFVLEDKLLSVSPGTQGRKSASNSRGKKKREISQEFPKVFPPWEKMEMVDACPEIAATSPIEPSPGPALGSCRHSRDAFLVQSCPISRTLLELEVLLASFSQVCWSCSGSFCAELRLSFAASDPAKPQRNHRRLISVLRDALPSLRLSARASSARLFGP